MKRRKQRSKRPFILLLLLPVTIVFATIAYAVWQNYVSFNISLTAAKKPTITATCTLLNAEGNAISLHVNDTTKIIENTTPELLLISINITNTGKTPIDRIELNNTFPSDWTWQQAYVQLIQADQTQIEIDVPHFTTEYTSKNTIIITIPDIKSAAGKTLNQNESIIISLYTEYDLIGQQLPTEHETNPPEHTNTATAKAWIGSWQSESVTATTAFTTYIYWI